jgi:hypothetical protein
VMAWLPETDDSHCLLLSDDSHSCCCLMMTVIVTCCLMTVIAFLSWWSPLTVAFSRFIPVAQNNNPVKLHMYTRIVF